MPHQRKTPRGAGDIAADIDLVDYLYARRTQRQRVRPGAQEQAMRALAATLCFVGTVGIAMPASAQFLTEGRRRAVTDPAVAPTPLPIQSTIATLTPPEEQTKRPAALLPLYGSFAVLQMTDAALAITPSEPGARDANAATTEIASGPVMKSPKGPSRDSFKKTALRTLMVAIGSALDVHSTNKAMHTPGLEEQNSWLYGKRPSLGRLIGTKIALDIPLLWAAHKAARNNPVDGMVPAALSAAAQSLAAGMNYAIINKQVKRNGGGE